jgi:hypothetical protein
MQIATHPDQAGTAAPADRHEPSRQAFFMLHWGFVAAPFLAGIDKFFNLLTRWESYLAPALAKLSPLSPSSTMMVVGVIEMLAALIVAVRPRIGAYVVAAWLAGIILNLLLLGHGYDIALRDFGLFLGALALGRLSELHDRGKAGRTSSWN